MNSQLQQRILEEKATRARERLLAVVDQLDRKRHALSHPLRLVKSQLPQAVWLVAGGVAAVTIVATIAAVMAKARAKRRPLVRLERHPRFVEGVGTRTAKALLTFALVQVGKTVIERGVRQVAAADAKLLPPRYIGADVRPR